MSTRCLLTALVFSAVLALTYSQECFTPSDCPNLSRQSCIFGKCIGPRIKPQTVNHDLSPHGEAPEAVPEGKAPKDARFVRGSAEEIDAPETVPQVQDPVPEGEAVQEPSEPAEEVLRARRTTS